MSTSKAKTNLLSFDVTRYLTADAAIVEYMAAVHEIDDAELLLLAVDDVARAKDRLIMNAALSIKDFHHPNPLPNGRGDTKPLSF